MQLGLMNPTQIANKEERSRQAISLSRAAALLLTGTAFAPASPPPNPTEDASPAAKTAPKVHAIQLDFPRHHEPEHGG